MNAPADSLGTTAEAARRGLLALVAAAAGPGSRLGGERELAQQLCCSRSTLRAALAALEREGAVSRVPGRRGGTFVAAARVRRDLGQLQSVPDMLAGQGFASATRVLGVRVVAAPASTRRELGLAPGALVVDLLRLRTADGVPLSLERAEFAADRFPGLADRELTGSVYALLCSEFGLELGSAAERITAVAAGAEDALALGVAAGAPLLAVQRTTVEADGTPFERAFDLFRADRVELTVTSPTSVARTRTELTGCAGSTPARPHRPRVPRGVRAR